MTVFDRRMDRRNVVLEYGADLAPGQAQLLVDQTHPFFFDHPLDHVPGLLLLEGAVQAAQNGALISGYVGAVRAQFIKYAFFDLPIFVNLSSHCANGHQICKVEITQQNILRARIEVDLRPEHALDPVADMQPRVDRTQACDGGLLNKLRAENVLITEPRLEADHISAQLLPMAEACVFADSFGAVHPLYLLEAFMQVQRYLNATQDGQNRIRDILTGVRIDLRRPLAALGDVTVHGARTFRPQGRGRLVRGADFTVNGQTFASCEIETARLSGRANSPKT